MEFSDLKYLLFSGIFLSGIGGYPLPPLTENHPAQKPLAEMGCTPPLNGKNPLNSFGRPPLPILGFSFVFHDKAKRTQREICCGKSQEMANLFGFVKSWMLSDIVLRQSLYMVTHESVIHTRKH